VRFELATDVDHVQAVSGPEDKRFWDHDNHQALCHGCHSYKTATKDGAFGREGDRGSKSSEGWLP
jgi:5-methylcytosine-specific restriction enzyme A